MWLFYYTEQRICELIRGTGRLEESRKAVSFESGLDFGGDGTVEFILEYH